MKHIFTIGLLLSLCMFSMAQVPNLKSRSVLQDSILETVFQKYLKANDSVADLRTVKKINDFSDSADKYIKVSAQYLAAQHLDSCIYFIHRANYYINNTQVLLHMKGLDKWLQYPTY